MKLEVDYSMHPAFMGSLANSRRSVEVQRYFAQIDEVWRDLVAPSRQLAAKQAGIIFDREVALLLADVKKTPALKRISEDYRPFVFKALDDSYQSIRAEVVQVIAGRAYRGVRTPRVESICAELCETGVAAFKMDPGMRARIVESLEPFYKEVEAQRNAGTGARCFVAIPTQGIHWDLLKDFVRQNHIEDAISAFAGFPLELVGYALTLSHPAETWFKICYKDIGLPATKTVQQHYDLDNLSAKSMFYLNDVSLENGPFAYIPESRNFIASRSQTSFFKYLDYANNDYATSRGVPQTIYNRPMFIAPSLRPAFASLPTELQGSACPGDDVLDGTPLSDALLKSERFLTSEQGDLMLFAGGETLHRGGIVTRGQRYALQMMYKSPPKFVERLASLQRALYRRVKKIFSRK